MFVLVHNTLHIHTVLQYLVHIVISCVHTTQCTSTCSTLASAHYIIMVLFKCKQVFEHYAN